MRSAGEILGGFAPDELTTRQWTALYNAIFQVQLEALEAVIRMIETGTYEERTIGHIVGKCPIHEGDVVRAIRVIIDKLVADKKYHQRVIPKP